MKRVQSNYWIIDGCAEVFRTLSDAKFFISYAYTPREVRQYLQYNDITHYVNNKPVSYVRISVKNDKPHYSVPIPLHIINFR